MILIASRDDLEKLIGQPQTIINLIANELVPAWEEMAEEMEEEWDPEVHGYLVLVESMADLLTPDLPLCYGTFPDLSWEYISHFPAAEAFMATTGTNQQVGAVIPDAEWLDPRVRSRLITQASEFAA